MPLSYLPTVTTFRRPPFPVLTVLTPDLIYPHLVNGLMAAWSPCLQSDRGTKLWDVSGRLNNGTLTNMDPPTDWVAYQHLNALDFDGTDDTVNCGTIADQNFTTSNFSVSAWVKLDVAGSDYHGIVTRMTGGANGWGLNVNFNDSMQRIAFLAFNGGGFAYVQANSVVAADTLYHVVGVQRSGTRYLFINGVQQTATSTTLPGSVSTTTRLGIFYSDGSSLLWNGIIDDVLIYSRALTNNEIREMYELGRGGWAATRRRTVAAQASTTQFSWWAWKKYGELVSV